ncbi:MAG TPA: TolC family protein, partial [Pirellulales bacterium]
GIPADLLTRRPDIRRAEQTAAAQCAQIGIAEAELYPSIAITGTVGFDSQKFTQLFKDHSLQGTIGPGFQWNVLNYGRLVNNVRLQDAHFHELVMTYRNTVLSANAEVEDGISEFLQSQLQAKAMQRSVEAAAKAVQLAITQYRAGLVDFNRVALLEQNLVQQQDLLAQALGDIDQGLVHTYRALGGGWEIRCGGQGDYSEADAESAGPAPNVEELPPSPKKSRGVEPSGNAPKGRPSPPKVELPGPAEGMPGRDSIELPNKPMRETPSKPGEELPALPMNNNGVPSPKSVPLPDTTPTPPNVPMPGAVPEPGPVPEPGAVPSLDGQPMTRKFKNLPVRQAAAFEFEGTSLRILNSTTGSVNASENASTSANNRNSTKTDAKVAPASDASANATHLKLRYSDEHPAIGDHAQLLPQDRGDTMWVR